VYEAISKQWAVRACDRDTIAFLFISGMLWRVMVESSSQRVKSKGQKTYQSR
jgi:hypothetical protein